MFSFSCSEKVIWFNVLCGDLPAVTFEHAGVGAWERIVLFFLSQNYQVSDK